MEKNPESPRTRGRPKKDSPPAFQPIARSPASDAVSAYRLRVKRRLATLPNVCVGVSDTRVPVSELLALLGQSEELRVFNYQGVLVEVIIGDPKDHAPYRLTPVTDSRVRVLVDSVAALVSPTLKRHPDTNDFYEPSDLPSPVARAVVEDPELRGIRRLSAVLTSPTILPTGEVVSAPGYHADSQAYIISEVPGFAMIDVPDLATAQRYYEEVRNELFPEFKFSPESHAFGRDVAMSALLTALAAPGLGMKAPAFVVSAVGQGAGKSTMMEIIAHMALGKSFPSITLPSRSKDPKGVGDHMKVQIESYVMQGGQFIHVANWPSGFPFGDANIAKSITTPTTTVRPYGSNTSVHHVSDQLIWFIDGNNFSLARETELERRVLLVQLVPQPGKSYLHGDTSDVCAYVLQNRGDLLGKCLSILRAYIHTGIPESPAQLAALRKSNATFPSFGIWDRYIRGCLLWLGRRDPVEANQYAQSLYVDSAEGNLIAVLKEWWHLRGNTPVTLAELATPTKKHTAADIQSLLQALRNFSDNAVHMDRGVAVNINSQQFDKSLSRYNGRPTGLGPFLLRKTGSKRRNATIWELSVIPGREDEARLGEDENVDPLPDNVTPIRKDLPNDVPF